MARYGIIRGRAIGDKNVGTPLPMQIDAAEDDGLEDYALDGEVDGDAVDDPDAEENDEELEVPDVISFTQVARVSPDGRMVVDIYADVDDVPGVVKYDVRLSVDS